MIRAESAMALQAPIIQALGDGTLDVIRIPGYLSITDCKSLTAVIDAEFQAMGVRLDDSAVRQRLGTPLSEATKSSEGSRRYYAEAQANSKRIHDLFSSIGTRDVLDRLQTDLSKVYGAKAQVASSASGVKLLHGIVRRWPSGAQALPHADLAHNEVLSHLALKRRVAANVYVQTGKGGELQFWSIRGREAYFELYEREGGGINPKRLGGPDFRISPNVGDLILFDSEIVHAVSQVTEGARTTVSCFIGFSEASSDLFMFA